MKSLKWFAIFSLLVLLVALTVSSLTTLSNIRDEIEANARLEMEHRIRTFWELLSHKGKEFDLRDGKLWVGSYQLNDNFELPDKIREIFGGTATIFMGDQRVSTNVLREDGSRATGTRLTGPAFNAIFKQNVSYRGEAPILGIPYYTAYDPIRDRNGKVIGVLYVGVKKNLFLVNYRAVYYSFIVVTLGMIFLFVTVVSLMVRKVLIIDRVREQNLTFVQSVVDALPLPIYFKDRSGRYVGCNAAFESFTGFSRGEIRGKTPFDIYPDNTAAELVEMDQRILSMPVGSNWTSEQHFTRRDGEVRELLFFKALFNDEKGEKGGLVGCILDQTEEKRAVAKLTESERNYRELVENSNSIILRIDTLGRITFLNEYAQKFFGYSSVELLGKPVVGTIVPERESGGRDLNALVAIIRANPESYPLSENENMTKDGRTVWVSWANRGCYDAEGKLVEILSIGQDITERKKLQDMMIISEKMVTMGGLAAGMAHELNNPLGGILQNAQNLVRRFSPELASNRTVAAELGLDLPVLQEYMTRRGIHDILSYITVSSEKAADIVSKMLAFSRGGESGTQQLTGLRETIERSIELASCDYDLKKRYNFRSIQVVREYGDDLPEMPVNAVELEQVLLSLLKNAAQAISDMPGEPSDHRITVRSRREGHYAAIDVEDDGPGVPSDLRARIFEPFFTSREIGSGTGLGLSVSYAIIAKHHGSISLDTSYTNGARFTVRLPL